MSISTLLLNFCSTLCFNAKLNDLELCDNSVIEYYGADYNKLSDGILAFYTVKSSDSKIAIISAIPDPRDKVFVNPSIDVEQIKSMYGKEAYMIDMRNVFLFLCLLFLWKNWIITHFDFEILEAL